MADTARQELAKLISGMSAPPLTAFRTADLIIALGYVKAVEGQWGVFLDDAGSMDMFPSADAAMKASPQYDEPMLERRTGAWTPMAPL